MLYIGLLPAPVRNSQRPRCEYDSDGHSTVGAAAHLSCVSSSPTIAELNGPNLRLESSEFLAVYRFSNA
jgi:hypothetical protein